MKLGVALRRLFYVGNIDDLKISIGKPLHESPGRVIHFVNAFSLICFLKEKTPIRAVFSSTAVWVSDGIGAVLFAKATTSQKLNRIPGPTFMEQFISENVSANLRQAIIGGSAEDLAQIQGALVEKYGTRFDLCISPPFADPKNWPSDDYVQQLSTANIDICWVALGTPLQDEYAHLLNIARPSTYICVGAGLDFISGKKSRAPRWMQKTGTEWVHRLITEPKRLWKRYTIGAFQFLYLTLIYWISKISNPVD